MDIKISKRDGREQIFLKDKIISAIESAFYSVDNELSDYALLKATNIADYIEKVALEKAPDILSVEDIQDLVEKGLMSTKRRDVAKAYILYRHERTRARGNTTDKVINEIVSNESDYWKTENSNKNPQVVTTQRDYIAGAASTDLTRRKLLPKNIVESHDEGILHFHDADYFAQNALTNCELVNLEDMLQNGTVINGVLIEKPHRILTASTIATQIILAVTSSTYGGCTITLSHLAPFVRDSYNYYLSTAMSELEGLKLENCEIVAREIARSRTKKEVEDAVQTFNYQVNSMTNTNGQAPFLSVCMYLGETDEYIEELALLIEEFLKQRILGFKNSKGVYVTPAFPKLLYVLEEANITADSPYWYLTKLAAECTSKRMVPDYISEKVMKQLKSGDCFPCMGCRSFLTPFKDENGKSKYYGRFNQGVVTINLPDIALSSQKDYKKFWEIFEERTELCHEALKLRHERIAGITSDAAPILWQHGAFARLKPNESVHKLLHNGYSTLSLGYAGLYECVKYMTGYSHTKEGKEFALEIMRKLNEKCNQWKEEEKIDYSLYGSPIESTTYKFAKCLKQRFGKEWEDLAEGRNYITNSYHVNVREPIDAFTKLSIESEFQALSPGGAISYIETPNLSNNIPAVIQLIQFIYNNIMYAEINGKFDYCQECGYSGEMEIRKKEHGELYWCCPNCGNTNQNSMNVARRTCGYIGTNFWNQGRTEEISERVLHLE